MVIVKIGGGATINLDGIAEDLAHLDEPVVVVHGANAARDTLAHELGRPPRTIVSESGYSSVYSDESAIELLMMAYAGLQNTRIVERLQRAGCNAVGLTGLDGRAVQGVRNRGIRVRDGERILVVRDRSGKPAKVNTALLELLIGHGYTPVLTVPLIDEQGFAINAENDDVVALLQESLGARLVIELIEAPGLLANPDDPTSVRARLDAVSLAQLETNASGRFKRKLHALRRMFVSGTPTVILADGRQPHPIKAAQSGAGTVITRDSSAGPVVGQEV